MLRNLRKQGVIWLVLIILMPITAVFAQNDTQTAWDAEDEFSGFLPEPDEDRFEKPRKNFWFGAGGEAAMYSQEGYAFGGSFTLGYGEGSAIGLKAAWLFNEEGIDTVELNFLLKFSFLKDGYKGPFIQLMGGPALFNRAGDFSIPSNSGILSAGLGLGWRFVLFNHWFVEPSVRGGYPYIFGASVSTGLSL